MSKIMRRKGKKDLMQRPYTLTKMTYVSIAIVFLGQRCNSLQDIDDATRTAIARVSNIIRVLASRSVPITDTIVLEAYEWAVERDSDVKDLLLEDVADALISAVTTNDELAEQW
jgi:hypothetical protein